MRYEDKTRLINQSFSGKYQALADYILNNPKFALWSGCSDPRRHHYGVGGLQYHTWEVINLCFTNAALVAGMSQGQKRANIDVIILSALFHDVGKMWDYTPTVNAANHTREIGIEEICANISLGLADHVNWEGAEHKRTIHHISRSGIEWTKAVAQTGVGKDIEDEVLHCILSHHGQREWGSPVAPKSREAWLLFLCDGISARMNDADSFDMKGRVKNV